MTAPHRILIVEDEPLIAMDIEQMVLSLGHRHEDAKLIEGHGCRRSGARPRRGASRSR